MAPLPMSWLRRLSAVSMSDDMTPISPTPALILENVRSGYGSSEVLHGVDLTIPGGSIVTVVGRNGMGKSTLLKTIMGLLTLTSGSIRLFGEEVGRRPAYRLARLSVSYVPQDKALFQDLSVEENLHLGLRGHPEFRRRLDWICEEFPALGPRLRQRAGTLSGGEQKMLLISRALISRPRLMLIDEISEGLQPLVISKVGEVLRRERESRGLSILLVEQNAAFALALADRYAVLKLGQVVASGQTGGEAMSDIAAQYMAL
jgi:ABC-type branched-subunit amino acid transport system ATPase component